MNNNTNIFNSLSDLIKIVDTKLKIDFTKFIDDYIIIDKSLYDKRGVYLHLIDNIAVYVGKTNKSLLERTKGHIKDLALNLYNKDFNKHLGYKNKIGWLNAILESKKIEIVLLTEDSTKEEELINQYSRLYKLYNIEFVEEQYMNYYISVLPSEILHFNIQQSHNNSVSTRSTKNLVISLHDYQILKKCLDELRKTNKDLRQADFVSEMIQSFYDDLFDASNKKNEYNERTHSEQL